MEIVKVTMENGTIVWMTAKTLTANQTVIHNPDGPAIIHTDGSTEWLRLGTLHRGDGPAKEMADGEQQWWVNGKRHRLGGPAIAKRKPPMVNTWWIKGERIQSAQHYQLLTKCSDEDLALLTLKYGEIK